MQVRNTIVRDSGAGALLGLAAGDQGSGAAYGHHTQLAMLVAYELLRNRQVESGRIRDGLSRLSGGRSGRSRVRDAPFWLHAYLEQERLQGLGVGPHGGFDVATRAIPIGIWHRDDPKELIADSIRAATATHTDRPSVVSAAILSGAIAGTSHGQYGRDLVAGALEVGMMAADRIADDATLVGDPSDLLHTLRSMISSVGAGSAEIVEQIAPERDSPTAAMVGLVIVAPVLQDPFAVIADVAPLRRRDIDVVISAVVGARVGLIQWPSSVANDTWFAEVGRRLATRQAVIGDLPDLFEVEERLSHGPPRGYR